jgi:3-oxoacyl-[acyl-carrier-protein] synthase III
MSSNRRGSKGLHMNSLSLQQAFRSGSFHEEDFGVNPELIDLLISVTDSYDMPLQRTIPMVKVHLRKTEADLQ